MEYKVMTQAMLFINIARLISFHRSLLFVTVKIAFICYKIHDLGKIKIVSAA